MAESMPPSRKRVNLKKEVFEVFEIVLRGNLPRSYEQLMDSIPARLEEILKGEAPQNHKGVSRFMRVNGKLFTPKTDECFMIRVKWSADSPPEEDLHLHYRWRVFYFQAFHAEGEWNKLNGFSGRLPPMSQLRFKNIYHVAIDTAYYSLGGYIIQISPTTFEICYHSLMQVRYLAQRNQLELLRDIPLVLPAVAISEALRDVLFQSWIKSRLPWRWDKEDVEEHGQAYLQDDVKKRGLFIPPRYHTKFNSWGSDSEKMFDPPPPRPGIGASPQAIEEWRNHEERVARLGIIKTPCDMDLPIAPPVYVKRNVNEDGDRG